MLIGLSDLAKKIFFSNLINSKVMFELVSNGKSVFLCFYATQLWPILISITTFFAYVQLENTVKRA